MSEKLPKKSRFLLLDVVAGLTASAVVLPKALAYATVAGLPVSVGLYTAFFPLILYGLLGSSRVLSVTSTATLAILTAAQLGASASNGDVATLITTTATLTLLTGLSLAIASALRLGFVANFISLPVLTGFKSGIGVVIVLDQIPKLFGLHFEKHGFFLDLISLGSAIPDASLPTLFLGLATMALLLLSERFLPHSPAPLVAVGGGILATGLLGLEAHGVQIVGDIPRGLPSVTLPELKLVVPLIPGALGLALMSFAETIAAGRAFRRDAEPAIRPNRELLATGVGNIVGAFFGAMPSGGGTSQTAVTRASGAASRNAAFVVAAVSLGTMLFLAPLLGRMPQATLAGVVIVYSVSLINPKEFVAIHRVRKMEFIWALVAFSGVLIFGTLQGILVAIVVSLLGLLGEEANAKVQVIGKKPGEDFLRPLSPDHPDDETFEGLLLLRPEGRLFFANADHVAQQIQKHLKSYQPRVVVLDLSRVIDIEYSALQMLVEGEKRSTAEGMTYWLAGLNPSALEGVRAIGLAERLGSGRLLVNSRKAIAQFQEMDARSRAKDGT